jgi:hypothetical protein
LSWKIGRRVQQGYNTRARALHLEGKNAIFHL